MRRLNEDLLSVLRRRKGGEKIGRTGLVICGGGMQWALGGGQALALERFGFGQVFDVVIGISAGALTGLFFLGGRRAMLRGIAICREYCLSGGFIDFFRPGKMLDVEGLVRDVARDTKSLRAAYRSPTEFYVGVSTQEGSGVLLNAKEANPDMLSAVAASMAMPGLFGQSVRVNGEEYVDGELDPLPLGKIAESLGLTHILVLPNTHFSLTDPFEARASDWILGALMRARGQSHLIPCVKKRRLRFRDGLAAIGPLAESGIIIDVLWPPYVRGIGPLVRNESLIDLAFREAARSMYCALSLP